MKYYITIMLFLLLGVKVISESGKKINLYIYFNGHEARKSIDISGSSDNNKTIRVLRKKTLNYIIENEIKNKNFNIPENIINKCLDLYFEYGKVDSGYIDKVQADYESLIKSLKAVNIDRKNVDDVYKMYMIKKMPKEQWLFWLKKYNTPEKISQLEKYIPKNLDDAKAKTKKFVRSLIDSYYLLLDYANNNGLITEKQVKSSKQPLITENIIDRWWKDVLKRYTIKTDGNCDIQKTLEKAPRHILPPKSICLFLQKQFYNSKN